MNSRRGVTLLELLIAITLVSLLSTGMLFAIRTGLGALEGVQRRVNDNRRVTGAYRILEQQLGSFLPVRARCGQATGTPGNPTMFFQGEPSVLRFVSSYSLEGAHRGHPVIVEIFVAPGDQGRGVRLLVNETPYFGPAGAGFFCMPPQPDANTGIPRTVFPPAAPRRGTFVLADRLSAARFSFEQALEGQPPLWLPLWIRNDLWPSAIRIELIPLEDDRSRVQPFTLTTRLRVTKPPDEPFEY
ncbi:MAG: prepilin-type N-terminal cleavage/methylation domain-containing protein [Bryobacteraceae bacterium]|nr:prepilin-type N-terminal cleavage/methylation domain-containing protein [Solibacteraceae bacterium]MCL4843356.1 prepilin-type N-terminal cleavage/methylation domain-containing protein [Bryobacteraceae bacterium]MCO5352669.1 prepilin-type N-terminal cleavage/methylation domain-containing protein [Bryobacteraceae bacterium]